MIGVGAEMGAVDIADFGSGLVGMDELVDDRRIGPGIAAAVDDEGGEPEFISLLCAGILRAEHGVDHVVAGIFLGARFVAGLDAHDAAAERIAGRADQEAMEAAEELDASSGVGGSDPEFELGGDIAEGDAAQGDGGGAEPLDADVDAVGGIAGFFRRSRAVGAVGTALEVELVGCFAIFVEVLNSFL